MFKFRHLFFTVLVLLFALLACNLNSAGAPSPDSIAISTAAAQTVAAQLGTSESSPVLSLAPSLASTPSETLPVIVPPTSVPPPTLTATVYIDPRALTPGGFHFPLPHTEQVSNQGNIAADSGGAVVAACPEGSIVVGGGFGSWKHMVVYKNLQDGNGWRVYARDNSGSEQLLNAYAVCLFNTPGTTSQATRQATVEANQDGQAYAMCPFGSVVTGGGYAITPEKIAITSSRHDGNGWRVTGRNISPVSDLIVAYAVCLSGTGGATARAETNYTGLTGEIYDSSVGCPAEALVTGGGYRSMYEESYGVTHVILSSGMSADFTKWTWSTFTAGSNGVTVYLYATCLTLP